MNFDENISMLSMAFYQVLLVSGPILALALGIGLLIGIIQAATSINEMTLSFVPKVIVVMLGIGLLGNLSGRLFFIFVNLLVRLITSLSASVTESFKESNF